jgi:SNF2 family DNA or RNA helicase
MIVELKNDQVSIQVSGIEQIKLKSKLASILGENLKILKHEIQFPKACLPLVSELIRLSQASTEITSEIEKFHLHEIARNLAKKFLEFNRVEAIPTQWTEILEPAQAVAVSCMTLGGLLGLCLFDEQGSGKTVMTIAAFDVLRKAKHIDAMIVVCPKSMVSEWPKDLYRFLGAELKIETAAGSQSSKFNSALKDFDVLISNYEGVEPMLVPLAGVSKKKKFLLVVDESYYAKNEDSQRSEIIGKLRQACAKCFVLCGTPAPNSAHDLINQFNLADQGYTFGGFRKSKDPALDWNQISLLVENKGMYIRRLKPEILDFVPEKNFHVLSVPLFGKQLLMYETARQELELELRGLNNEVFKKHVATYLQKRAALLQICCSPSSIDPTATDTPVKFLRLDPLLESLTAQGRKVIVWSFFKKSIDEVFHRYAKFNPVRVDGSVSTELRKQAVTRFQNDPDVMLFVGNPAAAGAGITLHASHDAVYISYSNQAAHYLQSLDRIHRRGQISEEVNYYLLVCEGTIEESEVKRLRGKEIKQHDLLGDIVKWPTSLDDALSELSNGHA